MLGNSKAFPARAASNANGAFLMGLGAARDDGKEAENEAFSSIRALSLRLLPHMERFS